MVWDCDDSLHCERERRVVLPEATNVVVGVVAAAEKLIHRGFSSESVSRSAQVGWLARTERVSE